jgi:hypothetical protein
VNAISLSIPLTGLGLTSIVPFFYLTGTTLSASTLRQPFSTRRPMDINQMLEGTFFRECLTGQMMLVYPTRHAQAGDMPQIVTKIGLGH